ncbi:MAG: GntR family transcriptional regulator [Nitriliruptorales bacterium]
MLVRIDLAGGVPLYEQIAAQLRSAIARGEAPPGSRLPPARELAEVLGVNMHTVLRAYGQLRDEGLVELRRGRGVTVLESGGRASLVELARNLAREARRQGLSPREVQALVEEQL